MSRKKSMIGKLLLSLLGQHATYRLGRVLYQQARGDVANDMTTNGELMIQQRVVEAWRRSSVRDDRLIVFDVGANVGDWSAAFLTNLNGFRSTLSFDLYMFEPVPAIAKVLRLRLGELDDCLHYEPFALSAQTGVDFIFSRDGNAGTNSLHRDYQTFDLCRIQINKTTVSTFCLEHGIDRVQLLKCDTEGHDMEVIRGALPMLMEGRISLLQFEYNHRWIYARHFLKDVFDIIEGLPYCIGKIQRDHIIILNKWHPELERYFEGNYLLILDNAMGWLPTIQSHMDCNNTIVLEM